MHKPTITALLLFAVLLACGAADKEKAADTPKGSSKPKAADKPTADNKKGKGAKEKEDKTPACMHCGATCGLEPFCVCEPGTKKEPKVEFDVKCEPICVAGCSKKPWPFGCCEKCASCTSCCEEPCRCPGWVRNCKKLKKETTDEEVPTVKREVAYICDCCAGRCTAGCCEATLRPRSPSWWTRLRWW